MLVLSLRRDGQDRIPHVLAQFEERVGAGPKSLLQVLTEVNLYLPDDWRLTRSHNDFRILVALGESCYSLVGESYRHGGDAVLHIVDTVLTPSQSDRPGANRGILAEQPELLTPNLYFFTPCPEGSPSPLFARQYEKIRLDTGGKQIGTQYHRIHPLTKGGLDTDHYRWLKWDITGHVEFVNHPDPGFHGKDYWIVPQLAGVQTRGKVEDYVQGFESLLAEYGLQAPEPPDKSPAYYEEEYKLRGGDERQSRAQTVFHMREMLTQLGFTIEHQSKPRRQVDTYLDDCGFSLYRHGISLRLRKTKGAAILTLKVRPTDGSEAPGGGRYRRIEEEASISKAQEEAIMAGEWVSALPYRLVSYMAPEVTTILPVATIRTNRLRVVLANEALRRAELCYDIIEYEVGGCSYGPDIEIELESKGLGEDDAAALAHLLTELLHLRPSAESKYERALRLWGNVPPLTG